VGGTEGLYEDEGEAEYKDGGGGGEEYEDGGGGGDGDGEGGTGAELEIPNCVVYWYCPVVSSINWIP